MRPLPHNHRARALRSYQRGLTLIELMVAIVIGLILTGGVIQIFLGSHQTYRFQEELSRIQENGRYALETLARDIRNSDYRGCGGTAVTDDNLTDLAIEGGKDLGANFDMADAVWGFTHNGGWSPGLDGDVSTQADPGGDVIRLRSLDFGGSALVSEHQSSGTNLFVDDATHFEKDQNVIATNCVEAVKFTIRNKADSGQGNPQLTVAGAHPGFYDTYQPSGVHAGFGQRYYFIKSGGNGAEPGLVRLHGNGTLDQLAEGVEGVHFAFGEDTNGDMEVDVYRDADAVNDWDGVMAVRVSLLVRGREENITDEPQVVSFPPGEIFDQTADRRLRQVFTATVSLRNRMP